MPFPIAAVIGAVVSAYAANQQAKSAAMQSATDAANKPKAPPVEMKPVTLESLDLPGSDHSMGSGDEDPFAGENYATTSTVINTDPTPVEGTPMAPSAHGRTLEGLDSPTKKVTVGPPITDEGLQPSGGAPAPDYQQTQVPTDDGSGKMTGLEMAQLGLTLGSMLGKRKPGPPIPGLPGNSFPGMKPVFRG